MCYTRDRGAGCVATVESVNSTAGIRDRDAGCVVSADSVDSYYG